MYIGCDIAEDTFDMTVLTAPEQIVTTLYDIPNTAAGFRQCVAHLSAHHVTPETATVVMECTGVYSERLSYFLYDQGFRVCVEPPQKVKKAFYDKPKTDPVDSRQIAEYGYRFRDKLHPWQPREQLLDEVQVLLTLRERLKKAQTASRNAKRALTRKQRVHSTALQSHQDTIRYLAGQVKHTEREISQVLQQNPTLYDQTVNLTTMPCVGLLLAVNLAVMTDGFTHHVNARQISAFLGMCPWPYQSGTSVHRPASSDGAGPGRVRKLLFLAAMSARAYHPGMRAYFERKLREGKPKPLILNNIANKLLRVLCAMIRSGKPYMENYRSRNPRLGT
jgi:transposase